MIGTVVFASPYQNQNFDQGACCYERGFALPCDCCSSSYNMPAQIKTENCWNFYASGSFIYWFASEGNLDLAISASLINGSANVAPHSVVLLQDFEYKPGFRVAVGMDTNWDDWLVGADYTWVRQTVSTSSSAPFQSIGGGVWFVSNWFIQPVTSGQTISATHIDSKWHLGLDWINAYISRPYYQGRNVTISPLAGLTCALIRQTLNLDVSSPQLPDPELIVHSHNVCRSWAVGPTVGVDVHWLLGCGFRIESDVALDLLHTRYTKIYHSEDALTSNGIPVSCDFDDFNCVRAVTEAGLGLGWGSYFYCNQYAVDILLAYDFSIFWNQNMMRRLVDLNTLQQNAAAENFSLHGLTATVRFDF